MNEHKEMECFTLYQHELKYVIFLDLSKPANGNNFETMNLEIIFIRLVCVQLTLEEC